MTKLEELEEFILVIADAVKVIQDQLLQINDIERTIKRDKSTLIINNTKATNALTTANQADGKADTADKKATIAQATADKAVPNTTKINGKELSTNVDLNSTDVGVPAWARNPTKPAYTQSEVGLSNVNNTSDMNKPVSTAQNTAITAVNTKATNADTKATNALTTANQAYRSADTANLFINNATTGLGAVYNTTKLKISPDTQIVSFNLNKESLNLSATQSLIYELTFDIRSALNKTLNIISGIKGVEVIFKMLDPVVCSTTGTISTCILNFGGLQTFTLRNGRMRAGTKYISDVKCTYNGTVWGFEYTTRIIPGVSGDYYCNGNYQDMGLTI